MDQYHRIGVIAAMEEEKRAILAFLSEAHPVLEKAGLLFEEGRFGRLSIIVVCAGIGKVNAAMCAQILIDAFSPDAVLNIGVAGALDPALRVGDVVVSTESLHHDMDCSALGDPVGVIPRMKNSVFKADPQLIALACAAGGRMGLNVRKGRVVSGDQFIGSREKKEFLRSHFAGTCAEMEGCAVAHVCELNGVPHLILRSISDQADGGATMSYSEFMPMAAERAGSLFKGMLEQMTAQTNE